MPREQREGFGRKPASILTENLGSVNLHKEKVRVGGFDLSPGDLLINKKTKTKGSFFGVHKFDGEKASNLVVCDADKCFSLTKKEFLERYTVL